MKVKQLAIVFGLAATVGIGCYLVYRCRQAPDDNNQPTRPENKTQTTFNKASGAREISVASFNIQFLGNSTARDNKALGGVLKNYDVVVIQELVAPPYPGKYPDGTAFKPDPQARAFFDEMNLSGYKYVLSEENTGPGQTIHRNGSSDEWFVTFYKPGAVEPANDLPHGFLADQRAHNPDFDRVPYAFAFRSEDKSTDFVLISVHLEPDSGGKARRHHEVESIASWIHRHDQKEKDFIIMGDMNVENSRELQRLLPAGYASLNDKCVATNTNPHTPKPYDQVMYSLQYTKTDLDMVYGFQVIDLVRTLQDSWVHTHSGAYPGAPYNHNEFRKYYSDHNPVTFRIKTGFDND